LVPTTARRILDVGCAAGAVGRGLKARQPCEVTGIEYDPAMAEMARSVLDQVYTGDAAEMIPSLARAYFDCIILADVLEHLPDPARVLADLGPTLAPGGQLVMSIPNVRHWSVVRNLLEGRWDYEEAGLLDRTHLRFFTRLSFENMLREVGLRFQLRTTTMMPGETIPSQVVDSLRSVGLEVDTLASESQVYQYLYVAQSAASDSLKSGRTPSTTPG
jgi:SAM-dependent methyltransferase